MSKSLKWAILGTSFISDMMAEAVNESSLANLSAICSRDQSKGEALANKHNITHVYTDYTTLLNDANIDVVYIGLPNHLHKSHTLDAIKANKHVLCEKPLVLNETEADEVIAALDNSACFCMEGLMYRHHPLTHRLKQIITSGELGVIRFINASYAANIAEIANPTAGGAIRNLGCYPLSLTRYLLEAEPTDISAIGRHNTATNNDHQGSALMRFSNSVIASLTAIDDVTMSWYFEVHGTKGNLKMITNPWWPEKTDNKILLTTDKPREITVTASQSLFTYQVDALCKKISGKTCDSYITMQDSRANAAALRKWGEMLS